MDDLRARAIKFLQKRFPQAVVLDRTLQLRNKATGADYKAVHVMVAFDPVAATKQAMIALRDLGQDGEVRDLATACGQAFADLKNELEVQYGHAEKKSASVVSSTRMTDSPKIIVYTDVAHVADHAVVSLFEQMGHLVEFVQEAGMLISKIAIEGYRTFANLTVDGLQRVNLFVGRNNTGKTALLEAAEAVVSAESSMVLYRPSIERGEVRPYRGDARGTGNMTDVRRWFHGHRLAGSTISIKAMRRSGADDLSFECRVETVPDEPAPIPPFMRGGFRLLQRRSTQGQFVSWPVRPDGGLGVPPEEVILEQGLRLKHPVHFIGTALSRATELESLWSKVQLTPGEQDVEASVRLVEPRVRRIGFQGRGSDVGCSVLLDGGTEPIPLGSLGEGTTRMLGLALGLANTVGGYLFIDEIDSGLHYSVMSDLWRAVIATAKRLDVQVFATTHSFDCVSGLGVLLDTDPSMANDVALHRLECGLDHTTPYDASEIAAAARHHMELR